MSFIDELGGGPDHIIDAVVELQDKQKQLEGLIDQLSSVVLGKLDEIERRVSALESRDKGYNSQR